mmetsp:Transcript_89775/g.290519  ORF Transcript_89775/g.290519 Transcript_89775/m.290519 type:complete len:242 (+) Transcript_89775:1072-1797(+)
MEQGQEQVKLLEAPQSLHDPENGYDAEEHGMRSGVLAVVLPHGSHDYPHDQRGHRREKVDDAVGALQEDTRVRRGTKPQEHLDGKDAIEGDLNPDRDGVANGRRADGLQRSDDDGGDDERCPSPCKQHGRHARVGLLQKPPDLVAGVVDRPLAQQEGQVRGKRPSAAASAEDVAGALVLDDCRDASSSVGLRVRLCELSSTRAAPASRDVRLLRQRGAGDGRCLAGAARRDRAGLAHPGLR